ncbi:polyketide synthase dehydratase domain-containing protein [Desulfobulbus sp.]|uniref:polyketide synthase dehydratase domain-containing protein n=1 Tax=Desulfobulbus sp. TaxID=895 RepID=UPI00286F72F8|nr:polyketide synthase dehydratase domain-containing protein [Desulfobulbus sp.]
MPGERREIVIPVRPWFADHRFAGRIVLAAVEAMQILAATVQATHPHLEVGGMRDGRFAKLLEIPPAATEIDALVESEPLDNGEIRARLMTRTQGKAMARLVVHCELTFADGAIPDGPGPKWATDPWPEAGASVSAEQVYRELVPFGPAYRSLQDRLVLHADAAWGTVLAPEPDHSPTGPLGSPFPLDGAMHAACVHGQLLVDFVPFPVGFAARRIARPTRTGERYRTLALLQAHANDQLVYDLCILDEENRVRETIKGLRMRDVSRGQIKPPAWIKAMAREGQTMGGA